MSARGQVGISVVSTGASIGPRIDWTPVTVVLFDLDDTLWDHRWAADIAAAQLAVSSGVQAPTEEVISCWRELERHHFSNFARGVESFEGQQRSRMRGLVGHALSNSEADAKYAVYLRLYQDHWRLFSDVVPALSRCRSRGMSLGIVTNGDPSLQSAKIKRLGLAHRVDAVIISGETGDAKPSAAIFERACLKLACRAENALMVGNDLHADVIGAQSAGLQALLLDRTASRRDALASLDDLVPPPRRLNTDGGLE